ncbi:MAG: AMP-binding protein [Bacteroidota bacterium]
MRQLILKYKEDYSSDISLTEASADDMVFGDALSLIHSWQRDQQNFVFQTSGSTGVPKTISVPRWKMELSANRTIKALQLDENQTALLCMNPSFIGGAMMIVRALTAKMNLLIVAPAKNPLQFVNEHFDFTAMVPMQLVEILNARNRRTLELLNKSQNILLGGAAVSASLENQVSRLKPTIWSTYGMTETISHIALRRLNGDQTSSDFHALDDIKISLGLSGNLRVKDKITDDKWLETNDIVELTSKSSFKWLGRLDNVINTGGIKVFAESVERAITPTVESLNISNRYFVSGLKDPTYGEMVTLFLESESEVDEEKLLNDILANSGLSKYETPKRIVILKDFPETASGKIDKQKIIQHIS